MALIGNIRKMRGELDANGVVQYTLPLYFNLEKGEELNLNPLIGKEVSIHFTHNINCVATGKKIKKTFGEGLSYDAFMNSPLATPSIIRPELSRIHEGIALRDEEWERKHHLQPHFVYLSKTAGIKVGVTRSTQVPSRWIDQGAVEAVRIAETPYRQAAGLIEVALKEFIADKTNWQRMLKNELSEEDLLEKRDEIIHFIPNSLKEYSIDDDLTKIQFPVLKYPTKVKSMKLDKVPIIEKRLIAIKGQYLIFEDETVINIRSHAGYEIEIDF